MNIYLYVSKQMTDVKLLQLHRNNWNHLTVCKQMNSDSFKNFINKIFTNHIYLIDMYKKDLALNNLQ